MSLGLTWSVLNGLRPNLRFSRDNNLEKIKKIIVMIKNQRNIKETLKKYINKC